MGDDGQNRDIFRYVLIGLFCGIAVLAVIVFANIQAGTGSGREQFGDVEIWGTRDRSAMLDLFKLIEDDVPGIGRVNYTQMDPRNFYNTFLEAAAVGRAPDMLLVDQSNLYLFADKSIAIPFENFPEQQYRSLYVEAAEVFIRGDGVIGIPFMIDPMVMFWNRDMFTNAGISQPPAYWDDFLPLTRQLNRVDNNLNILKSTVAFGEAANINNFKEIFSLLMLQTGTRITSWNRDQELVATLRGVQTGGEPAGVATLRFFTDFSNPSSQTYSWNRSLPEARAAFTAGDLAVYFGRLSELPTITRLNPNLNYAIALAPQVRGTERRVTYAHVDAFVIPRASRNSGGAYGLAVRLSTPEVQLRLAQSFGLPPLRRDLLAQRQSEQYWSVAYDSAIIARTWLDPNPQATSEIFRRMIESVKSGELTVSAAVSRAEAEMGVVRR